MIRIAVEALVITLASRVLTPNLREYFPDCKTRWVFSERYVRTCVLRADGEGV